MGKFEQLAGEIMMLELRIDWCLETWPTLPNQDEEVKASRAAHLKECRRVLQEKLRQLPIEHWDLLAN